MNHEKTDWKLLLQATKFDLMALTVAALVALAVFVAWGNWWLGGGMGILAFWSINRLLKPYRLAVVGKMSRDARFTIASRQRARQPDGYIPPSCACTADSKSVYDEACGCPKGVQVHQHCCNCGGAIFR